MQDDSQALDVGAEVDVAIAIGFGTILAAVLRRPAGADAEPYDPDRIEKMYWDGFRPAQAQAI